MDCRSRPGRSEVSLTLRPAASREVRRPLVRYGQPVNSSNPVRDIVSFPVPANTRSRAVMARLGLTHDPSDDFDHPGLPSDSPLRRHVLYRLDADRFVSERRHRRLYAVI